MKNDKNLSLQMHKAKNKKCWYFLSDNQMKRYFVILRFSRRDAQVDDACTCKNSTGRRACIKCNELYYILNFIANKIVVGNGEKLLNDIKLNHINDYSTKLKNKLFILHKK